MKLKDNEELSFFEIAGIIRGGLTQDKHHFFNQVKSAAAGEEFEFKKFIAGTFPKLSDGARIPMNKQANNPALSGPTVTAMKMFGQLPIFKKAVDQIHAKKIGVFPTATHGSGTNAFEMLSSSVFGGGEQTLQSVVNKSLFGGFADLITPGHHLEEQLQTLAKSVGSVIGAADGLTKVNPQTDVTKLIQGLSHGFGGGIPDLFNSSVFSDGADMAKEAIAFIKKLQG